MSDRRRFDQNGLRPGVAVEPEPDTTAPARERIVRLQGREVVMRTQRDGREIMDRVVEPVEALHHGFKACDRCTLQYLDTGTGPHFCPPAWTNDDLRRRAERV